jgi:hypothetical protein
MLRCWTRPRRHGGCHWRSPHSRAHGGTHAPSRKRLLGGVVVAGRSSQDAALPIRRSTRRRPRGRFHRFAESSEVARHPLGLGDHRERREVRKRAELELAAARLLVPVDTVEKHRVHVRVELRGRSDDVLCTATTAPLCRVSPRRRRRPEEGARAPRRPRREGAASARRRDRQGAPAALRARARGPRTVTISAGD